MLHVLRYLAREVSVCASFYASADLPLFDEVFDSLAPEEKWAPRTQPVRRARRNCGKGWLYRDYKTSSRYLKMLGYSDEDACSAFGVEFSSVPGSERETCIDCTAGLGGPVSMEQTVVDRCI